MTSNSDGFELSKRREAVSMLSTLLFFGASGLLASESKAAKPIKKKPFSQKAVPSCLVYSYHGLSGSYSKQEYVEALDASIQALANTVNGSNTETSAPITKQVLILRALRTNFDA